MTKTALAALLGATVLAGAAAASELRVGVQNMSNDGFWKGLLGFIYKLIG